MLFWTTATLSGAPVRRARDYRVTALSRCGGVRRRAPGAGGWRARCMKGLWCDLPLVLQEEHTVLGPAGSNTCVFSVSLFLFQGSSWSIGSFSFINFSADKCQKCMNRFPFCSKHTLCLFNPRSDESLRSNSNFIYESVCFHNRRPSLTPSDGVGTVRLLPPHSPPSPPAQFLPRRGSVLSWGRRTMAPPHLSSSPSWTSCWPWTGRRWSGRRPPGGPLTRPPPLPPLNE